MVGLQTLDLAIGVRVPASQPNRFKHTYGRLKSELPIFVCLECASRNMPSLRE